MNPEQIKKIVDTILSIQYNDQRMQEATDTYFKVMYPESYEPIIEGNATYALQILGILHPDIADWLSYYLYEVPLLKMSNPDYDVVITQNWKEWKLNTATELQTFLISEYALDGSEKVV